MDTQALFSHGGELVKNPNYSPNNDQPEFILNTDIGKRDNSLASAFYNKTTAGENYTIQDEDIIRKTKKYGIPLTKEGIESGLIDKQLYDAQSGLGMFLNSIEQTLVGEIGLGTLKGLSELADMIGNAISRNNFFEESGLTKFLDELQEKNKQAFEINTMPGVTLGHGALSNAGWWASNIPSIASSITLLIPARAVTKAPSLIKKGVNALGRIGKTADEISDATSLTKKGRKAIINLNKSLGIDGLGSAEKEFGHIVAENIADAALMRTMENYQEAKQVNADVFDKARDWFADNNKYAQFLNSNPQLLQDIQQKGIDINDKDEVARYIAQQSAVKTFVEDYANILFDIIQVSALKNPAKIAKKAVATKAVATAQRQTIEKPMQLLTETAAAEKKLSIGKKAANWLKDVKGAGFAAAAEFTEGIEEAVNYVAQQEGMTYGNILMGDKENVKDLSARLVDYWHNPEMWDAAFWGFLGGITFEAVGSKYNQLGNALRERREDKKAGNEVKSFSEYMKNNEDRYRVADIGARVASMQELSRKMNLINSNQNPYEKDDDGNYKSFVDSDTNSSEKEVARTRAINDFISDLTFSALQSGNYRLLESYLTNENVRKALVESKIIDEEGSQEFISDIVGKMNKIADKYEGWLEYLNNLTRNEIKDIPVEYLQMIARENTQSELNIETLGLDRSHYEARVKKLLEHSNLNGISAEELKDNIELSILTQRLGEVIATIKGLEQDEENKDSLSTALVLPKLKKERDLLLSNIAQVSQNYSLAAVTYALIQASNFIFDGEYIKADYKNPTADYIAYMRAIETRDSKLLQQLLSANNVLDLFKDNLNLFDETFFNDAQQGEYDILKKSIIATNKFRRENKHLNKLYEYVAETRLQEIKENSNIINTKEAIQEKADYIHDSLNDALNKAQKEARQNIFDIADRIENGEEKIANYIYNKDAIDGITPEDQKLLDDSIEVMNFRRLSEGSFDRFLSMLNRRVMDKKMKKLKEELSSSAKQKREKKDKKSKQEDTTKQEEKSNVGQENDTESQINQPKQPTNKPQRGLLQVTISPDTDSKLNVKQIDNNTGQQNVVETSTYNGVTTLHTSTTKNNIDDLKKSTTLFDGYDDAKHNDPNYKETIVSNPQIIITTSDNGTQTITVEHKGEIRYTASSSLTGESKSTITTVTDDNGNEVVAEVVPVTDLALTEEGREIMTYRDTIMQENIQYYLDNKVPINKIIEDINNKLKEEFKGENDDVLDEILKNTSTYVNSIKALKVNSETTEKESQLYDGVEEIVKESIISEEVKLTDDLIKSISKIIPYYVAKHKIPIYKVNGVSKQIINLQELLRDLQDIYEDRGVVSAVYDLINTYLNTKEAKKKYIITDVDRNDPNFLDKVNESLQSKIDKTRPINTIQEVFTNSLDEAGQKQLKEVKRGDELYVDKYETKDGKKGIIIKSNGITIGRLPGARRLKGNTFELYNNRWRVTLKQEKGKVKSDIIPLYIQLFKNRDVFNKLQLLNSSDLTAKEKDAIKEELNTFLENYEYKGKTLKDSFLAERDKDKPHKAVNQLLNLYNFNLSGLSYEDIISTLSDETKTSFLEQSLNNYFEKLYNSYSTVANLVDKIEKGKQVKVTVNKAPEGVFINNPSEHNQSNSAISEKADIRLGVVESKQNGRSGDIKFSDGLYTSRGYSPVGGIVVSVKSKNGDWFNVIGQSIKFGDTTLDANSDAGKLINFIKEELNKRIDNWNSEDSKYEDFINFLKKLLYKGKVGTVNEPLFTGINFKEENGKIQIGLKDNKVLTILSDRILLTSKDNNGVSRTYTFKKGENNTANTFKKQLIDILNNSIFNVSYKHLDSFAPNKDGVDPTAGFISKNADGSLHLAISSLTGEVFELNTKDYKDFVIRGGFLRVNTHVDPNTNTNFTDSNKGQQLTVKVDTPVETISPVKGKIAEKKKSATKIEKVVNDKRKNIAVQAFTIAGFDKEIEFDGKKVNVLKVLKDLGLISNKVKFDKDFNSRAGKERTIADTNAKDEITIGTNWVDMFNEVGRYATTHKGQKRQEALRKLIHEHLHIKLHESEDNLEILDRLQEVFDEFKQYVLDNDPTNDVIKKYFNETLDEATALEEFIVESFTSKELANYLNNIESKGYKHNTENRTLWQKILDFIGKLFGYEVTDDSLYAKEYNLLAGTFEPTVDSSMDTNVEIVEERQEETQPEEKVEEPVKQEQPLTKRQLNRRRLFESAIEEDLTDEEKLIKDKAIANGTYLKAPNGNKTNLTPKQWLQVRTKAFKDWFGDWENDPENASKVVDENGEPLVVYHGSNNYGFSVFDPLKADDKKSIFFSDSRFIASTYTNFEPLRNTLVKQRLLNNNAIELIKNGDYEALQKLLKDTLDYSLPYPGRDRNSDIRYDYHIDEKIGELQKELLKPNLSEEEVLGIQADIEKLEDTMWFSNNYSLKIHKVPVLRKNGQKEERIKIKIDDAWKKYIESSYFIEKGIVFEGTPEQLIEALQTETKTYDLFLNIKNPLILSNQKGEFGASNNWDNVVYEGKRYKTREISELAQKKGYDGVLFKNIIDHGGYKGDTDLSPVNDASIAYDYFHEGEDSYTGNNIYSSNVYIVYSPNQVKSAISNNGKFSRTNNNIYQSALEEETYESVDEFINNAQPEDQEVLYNAINKGELSIMCN